MLDWLRRGRKNAGPLTGAPAVRRLKAYSAASGYVYQYFYEGQRGLGQGTEFVFSVSADRKGSIAMSVFVQADAIEEWERGHGRVLAANERYAVAKVALFQAFDERAGPDQLSEQVQVRYADLEMVLETLGID